MFGASELVKRPLSDIRDAGNEEHGSHSLDPASVAPQLPDEQGCHRLDAR